MATKRYFEFSEGSSNKFWEIWIDGNQVFTRYGKIGASGQVTLKDEGSPAGAQKLYDKLVREKTGKGYQEKGGAKTAAAAAPSPAAAPALKKVAKKVVKKEAPAPEPKPAAKKAEAAAPAGGIRLEYTEDGSSKFWQISTSGNSYTATWGRIGTPGQSQTKTFGSDWEAKSERNKLVEEKKKKGYQVVSSGEAPKTQSASASNADLEKQILANPDKEELFHVYADWLQSQGDVRGELAAVQAQLAKNPKDAKLKTAERRLLWDQRAHFYGALAPYVTRKKPEYGHALVQATWRLGFIDELTLSAGEGGGDDEGGDEVPSVGDVSELIDLLPKVPSARFLRSFTIGCPVYEDEFHFEAGIKSLAKALPGLPLLRRLTLGDFTYEDSELSWSHLGKADALWPHLGKLEYLKIHAGSFSLGNINLPACREFRIETGGLDKKSMAAIAKAKWPNLETVSLWFGPDEYGGDCSVKDLSGVMDGTVFPKVKHLGLANSTFGDAICEALAKSKVLKNVTSLDLSMSHLTIKGLQALAAAKPKLEKLDVSRCLLDSAGVKLARTLAKVVETKNQEDASEYTDPENPDYRYSAVGE